MNQATRTHVRCAVVGGGPAGMMLGYLLARAGVQVQVLEKHADFLRDFRGDTIHPSTLELMHELGLLEKFLEQPHQKVKEMRAVINGHSIPIADFSHLPTKCKFIAFMPQWDFLNFLSAQAKQFPSFKLLMKHEVLDLIFDGDRVTGVRAGTTEGNIDIRADLVVGCDGRDSIVRDRAKFEVREFGVPIDVLWMRLPKRDNDPEQTLGFFKHGTLLVLLDRGDYWQCGFVIPKGDFENIKARGLPSFQEGLIGMADFLRGLVSELDDWSKVRLLTVQINRLRKWYRDGLLCIGDAAHAMSPAGGVGINLAIQDAVATANLLATKLRDGPVSLADLDRVQRRRQWPATLIQTVQTFVHKNVVTGKQTSGSTSLPFLPRLFKYFPILRRLPARFIGLGPRPEHVHSSVA